MRLLIVSNGFPPRGQWGTEYYTHELVRGLRAAGHEIGILHPDRSGARERFAIERVEEDGFPIFLIHNAGDPRKSFADSYVSAGVEQAFGAVLDEFQPDLVHFVYLLWGLSVRMPLVAKERGLPTVATLTDYGLLCHRGQMYDWRLSRCQGPHPAETCARCIREPSPYDDTPPRVAAKRMAVRALASVGGGGRVVVTGDVEEREAAVRASLDSLDALIAPTRVLADAFVRFGVSREKLETLVYAIDPRPYACARPEPPAIGDPGNEVIRFGFLGQFTPHKGLGTLLEAVEIMEHRLPESVEPWTVRLYGRPVGGRHKRFASAVFDAYRGTRVVVCDPFPSFEAPLVLADLHAVVLPSEWDENAPLTVLQCRAAGVPLIASDVHGVAEVVEDGVHGRLFPMGDAEALADRMREVVLGRVGRTGRCDLPVSQADHIARVTEIYEGALRAAHAPSSGS